MKKNLENERIYMIKLPSSFVYSFGNLLPAYEEFFQDKRKKITFLIMRNEEFKQYKFLLKQYQNILRTLRENHFETS